MMKPAASTVGSEPFDPSHRFVTSWLLSPWPLFACRAILAAYVLATRIFIYVYECTHPDVYGCRQIGRDLSFFTVLANYGMLAYFVLAALNTLDYSCRRRSPTLLARAPRALQGLYSLLYTTIVAYPIFVTAIFWGLLSSSLPLTNRFLVFSNTSEHALNSVFCLFEILVPRTEAAPPLHALWCLLILAAYLGVFFITVAVQGWYPYPILDYRVTGSRGIVAGYIFGIGVGSTAVFFVVYGLMRLRKWVTEDKLGFMGKFGEQRVERQKTDYQDPV